jgi:hypothetical protein
MPENYEFRRRPEEKAAEWLARLEVIDVGPLPLVLQNRRASYLDEARRQVRRESSGRRISENLTTPTATPTGAARGAQPKGK